MTDCEKCEYWNIGEGVCGAFECNGIGCPSLPCEQWWIFTFCGVHEHAGYYVKIKGTYRQAREKMIEKYGLRWGFQYSEDEWNKFTNDPKRWWPMEEQLEVIE